jgi:subtilisin
VTREWAFGGADGAGARGCILDSGVEEDHPVVGPLAEAVVPIINGDELPIMPDQEGDVAGHGTACAGIIRSLAPICELASVRVLGAGARDFGVSLRVASE